MRIKRRNTIDNLHGNWPIVQYYYTHNNGSCDDILIYHRSLEIDPTSKKRSRHKSDYKNRRKTFPQEKTATAATVFEPNRRDSNKIEIASSSVIRRWSFTAKEQPSSSLLSLSQQKNRKKRETLANIISNLSRSNSSTVAGGNISSMNYSDTVRAESDLNAKWETIRQYNPQLDNEKILEQDDDSEDESYLHNPQQAQMNEATATVGVDKVESNLGGSNSDSSNDSNGLFLPAGQENTTTAHTPSECIVDITNEDVQQTVERTPTAAALETNIVPMAIDINHTDMFLFLFGFIFFPLWWIGTWRFFMQSDKRFLHRQQRGFQIVNCCMTLVSLLMTGLIIGLITVWA